MSRARLALLAALVWLEPSLAGAHLVHGTATLSSLVAQADVVARARIVQAQGLRVEVGPGKGRPLARATLLETLKGGALLAGAKELRFAQHGHGAAEYADGDEVIVFLREIERSRELDALAGSGVRFVSVQEHDEKLALHGAQAPEILRAVRAYVTLTGEGPARTAAFRQLTLELVGSPAPRVSLGAMRDLVLLGDAFELAPEESAALARRCADPSAPIQVRVGLLAELERRGLSDAAARWAALVRETPGEARIVAIQAAGAHPSDPVRAALAEVVAGSDARAAAAALVALGWRGNDAAVPLLASALAGSDARRSGAAVRGLAGVGTPAARAALEQGAASSPDANVRRAAAAALRRLDAAR